MPPRSTNLLAKFFGGKDRRVALHRHRDQSVALGIATIDLSRRRKTPICHTSSKSHGLRDGLPRCPTPRAVHHGRHPTPCHWICTEARDRHLRLDPAKMVPDPVRKERWHLRDWRLIRVVDEGTAPSCHLLLRWAAGEMPDPWSLAAEPIPPPVAGAGHPEAEQEVYASIQLWGARSDPGKGGSGKKRQIRWQLGGRGTWKPNRRTK